MFPKKIVRSCNHLCKKPKCLTRAPSTNRMVSACEVCSSNPAGNIHWQRCCTRGESQVTCIMYASAKVQISLPTLALKTRGDITRSQKQGMSGPKMDMCRTKFKKKFWSCINLPEPRLHIERVIVAQ